MGDKKTDGVRAGLGIEPALISSADAANYLGVSASFLKRDRAGEQRIAYIKISSNCVRYEIAALDAYIESNAPEKKRIEKDPL